MSSRLAILGRVLVLSFILYKPPCVSAQGLVINEVTLLEPSLRDEDGQTDNGWIEFKNTSDTSISTGNLTFVANDSLVWKFPDLIIPADSFLFVWLSGKNRKAYPNLHANFKVSNVPNNTFKLIDIDISKVVDSLTITSKLDWYESYNRFRSDWCLVTTRTPKAENEKFGYWRRIAYTSPFKPRDSAPTASLYYHDKFWVLSGWTGDSFSPNKEVWVSDDLKNWTLVTSEGPFQGDAFFIVFEDKMWAFDGDAYTSTNGANWEKVATGLPFSVANRVAIFDGKLWVVHHKNIYSSTNGIDWLQVTDNAPWEPRELPGFLSFKNKLWFFGGAKYHQAQNPAFTDVWSSNDGIAWELVTDSAKWPGRAWFGSAVFDNKMWIYSGWDYYAQDDTNNVWYTEDGKDWFELKSSTQFPPRHAPYSWVARGSLWISSGYYTMHLGLFNDVWRLDSLSKSQGDNFFLKPGGEPGKLYSWGNKKDGSGFTPHGFDFDGQKFTLANNSYVYLGSSWLVSGANSVVEIGTGADSVTFEINENSILNSDVKQYNMSTLVIKNSKSPHILSADKSSKTVINTKDSFLLDATQLSNLILVNGSLASIAPTLVTEKVEIVNGQFRDSQIQYGSNATLVYKSKGTDLNIKSMAITENYSPTKVIIDCDCYITIDKPLSFDSLVLKSGKLQTSQKIHVNFIESTSSTAYVVTVPPGMLDLATSDRRVIFPIGTRETYNPLVIESSNSSNVGAAVWENISPCLENEVNVSWVIEPSNSNAQSKFTLHWNGENEGKTFNIEGAALRRMDREWDEANLSDSTNTQLDTTTRIISSEILGNAILRIVDYRGPCNTNQLSEVYPPNTAHNKLDSYPIETRASLVVYPNPAHGGINILIPYRKKLKKIDLMDSKGLLVKRYSSFDNDRAKSSIAFDDDISPSLYFLKIYFDDEVVLTRLVIY